jgi:hypothetical protein
MTLSRYLRDYLYIPLGGNRCSNLRVSLNIMTTFVLGGLWHGASWMFVTWGALHGTALVTHRVWTGLGLRMPKALAWLLTFGFVNTTWVFFRAKTLDDALRVLHGMVDINSIVNFPIKAIPTNNLAWGGIGMDYLIKWLPVGLAANILCYSAIVFAFSIICQKNSFELMKSGHSVAKYSGVILLFCIALYSMMLTKSAVFLYFNF